MLVPGRDDFGFQQPDRVKLGYLVRHGELTVKDRWDGWGNYNLSPEGIQSAEQAAHWFSFDRIGRIIASDLPRTLHTAEIIMQVISPACPFLSTNPNLRPLNVGAFTGREKTDEAIKEFQWYKDHPDVPFPEGESVNQAKLRVENEIPVLLAAPYDGLPTIIVTHSSVIRLLMNEPDSEVVAPGGVIAVYMLADGSLEYVIVMGEIEASKGGS